MARAGASLAHCPHSNLKLASGIARVGAMLNVEGINIAVGTDGAASNNRLDVLAEGRLTALLAKAETGDAAAFDAHRTLHAMTRAARRRSDSATASARSRPARRPTSWRSTCRRWNTHRSTTRLQH